MAISEKKRNLFKAINYEPIPKGWEVHNCEYQQIALICGMRSGKSSCLVPEALEVLLGKNRNIWVVGIDYEKTDRFIWGSGEVEGIRNYIEKYFPWLVDTRYGYHRKDHYIQTKLNSTIKGKSVKYPGSFIAEPVDLMICEDAADYPQAFYSTYIRPRVVDKHGRIFLNSVPPIKRNWLTRVIQQESIKVFNWSMYDNPYVSGEEIKALEQDLPEYLRKAIVYGELPTEESSIFGNVREKNVRQGTFFPYNPNHLYQAGVDIGKMYDRTVLTISDLTDATVAYIDRFPPRFFKTDLVEQRLLNGLSRYNYPNTYVDVSGIGEAFRAMVGKHAFLLPYTIPSLSTRNTLIEDLSMAFERGYTFPNFSYILEELEGLDVVLRSNHHIYKTPHGSHDDTIISMALSIMGWAKRLYGGSVSELPPPMEVDGDVIEDPSLTESGKEDPIDLTEKNVLL